MLLMRHIAYTFKQQYGVMVIYLFTQHCSTVSQIQLNKSTLIKCKS